MCRFAAAFLPAAALAGALLAEGSSPRALVVVRTLVIDPIGTRTVDTDTARIPFGSKGLLMKRVPYAGPAISFRLTVAAGPPQEAGIPMTFTSAVWNGEAAPLPPDDRISRREEATVLAPQGSYLLELDHDTRAGRRIVLSITARALEDHEEAVVPPAGLAGVPIRFLLEVIRQGGGEPDPPDVRVMSSMVGQPVTYSSGVRLPGGAGEDAGFLGLAITLRAEQVQGDLISVGVELSGAEFVDRDRQRLEPFRQDAVRTVASGTPFDLHIEVPPPDPASPPPAGIIPVRYQVRITPRLGP